MRNVWTRHPYEFNEENYSDIYLLECAKSKGYLFTRKVGKDFPVDELIEIIENQRLQDLSACEKMFPQLDIVPYFLAMSENDGEAPVLRLKQNLRKLAGKF